MSDEIQKLILAEMKATRAEIKSDIKDLHSKVDKNYKELTNKHHELDKKVLGNKLKFGSILSLLSIFWAGIINYLSKKM